MSVCDACKFEWSYLSFHLLCRSWSLLRINKVVMSKSVLCVFFMWYIICVCIRALLMHQSFVCRYVLIDTPGQIEVFTWSASGTIITEALVCCCFKTVIMYMNTSLTVKLEFNIKVFFPRHLPFRVWWYMWWTHLEVLTRSPSCQTCFMPAGQCLRFNGE